jgi:uncharacterized phage-associated protein
MAHDPRSIANFVLDVADELGRPATNLSLNKIAYFLHGSYLARYGKPLVDAKIEAWEYGPVFREIYHEFKHCKNGAISGRAAKLNAGTGVKEICQWIFSAEEEEMLQDLAKSYLQMRAGTLVDLSHVHDGPWHEAWYHSGSVNPGMEISNASIERFFREQVRQ